MEDIEDYFQEFDSELIGTDFDHIDPFGEITDDGSNGEHTMDDIEL